MRPMQIDLNFSVVYFVDDYRNDNLVKNFNFSFLWFYSDATPFTSVIFAYLWFI